MTRIVLYVLGAAFGVGILAISLDRPIDLVALTIGGLILAGLMMLHVLSTRRVNPEPVVDREGAIERGLGGRDGSWGFVVAMAVVCYALGVVEWISPQTYPVTGRWAWLLNLLHQWLGSVGPVILYGFIGTILLIAAFSSKR